jgi:hypothetical protein
MPWPVLPMLISTRKHMKRRSKFEEVYCELWIIANSSRQYQLDYTPLE